MALIASLDLRPVRLHPSDICLLIVSYRRSRVHEDRVFGLPCKRILPSEPASALFTSILPNPSMDLLNH